MYHFKPDSSFFRKIAVGVVGVEHVISDLKTKGFDPIELERGARSTRIWKGLKRKTKRIPDLVCKRTGMRIEVRTKTTPKLQMSHSFTEQERSWDQGLVSSDLVAFPIIGTLDTANSKSSGEVNELESNWTERIQTSYSPWPGITYVRVDSLQKTPHKGHSKKGKEEASETSIEWGATFADDTYLVSPTKKASRLINLQESSTGKPRRRLAYKDGYQAAPGSTVRKGELICSNISPVSNWPNQALEDKTYLEWLRSPNYSIRFTSLKLARHNSKDHLIAEALKTMQDGHEDIYNQLEAATYLSKHEPKASRDFFVTCLSGTNLQVALEATICLGESEQDIALELLMNQLEDKEVAEAIRSASAWAISQHNCQAALDVLVDQFESLSTNLKEEVSLVAPSLAKLMPAYSLDRCVAAGGDTGLMLSSSLLQTTLDNEMIQCLIDSCAEQKAHHLVWLLSHQEAGIPSDGLTKLLPGEVIFGLSLLQGLRQPWFANHLAQP